MKPSIDLMLNAEDMSPEDAAEMMKLRVEAMLRGQVFVRPHYRDVPRWGHLGPAKRKLRKVRYALRITGSLEQAAKFLGLPVDEIRETNSPRRSPR